MAQEYSDTPRRFISEVHKKLFIILAHPLGGGTVLHKIQYNTIVERTQKIVTTAVLPPKTNPVRVLVSIRIGFMGTHTFLRTVPAKAQHIYCMFENLDWRWTKTGIFCWRCTLNKHLTLRWDRFGWSEVSIGVALCAILTYGRLNTYTRDTAWQPNKRSKMNLVGFFLSFLLEVFDVSNFVLPLKNALKINEKKKPKCDNALAEKVIHMYSKPYHILCSCFAWTILILYVYS